MCVVAARRDAGADKAAGQTSQGLEKYRMTQKKREILKNPPKNWRNPRKKIIDRNWTITACLLKDSNPNYQCLKITSCRWRPPPRMHSFTVTTHFKISRSLVSPCVCCMLCRMRLSLKRQVIMVHFLSINFFLGFLQFLLGFSKVHVFLCHPIYICRFFKYDDW